MRTMLGASAVYFGELLLLGRALKCGSRSQAPSNHLGESVEVSRAHEALMLHGLVSVFGFAAEFLLLQPRISRHALCV